jgi:hypothetical protein
MTRYARSRGKTLSRDGSRVIYVTANRPGERQCESRDCRWRSDMREKRITWIFRRAFMTADLLAGALVMLSGEREGRCGGGDEARESATKGSTFGGAGRIGEVTAGLNRIWRTLGRGAESSCFAVDGASEPKRRITWPLLKGPLKVSLGASAATGGHVGAGPVLLVETRFRGVPGHPDGRGTGRNGLSG